VAYEFKLPDLGEGLTEGEIARWLVEEGQDIAEDDPLVEIATDKTTVEIPSPAAGTVSQILVAEGEVVPVGTVLVVIAGAERSTGPVSVSDTETGSEGTRVALRGVRRQMFEHLTRAHREIPPVTWVEECDFSDVDLKRLVPLVLHAVAESLREFPELNAQVEDGELVLLDRYDIGVAVQTEQGLVVPVVHGADRLELDELDAEVKRLAEGAQAGTLKPEELRGGTFTVTSAGKAAGLFTTPLVNHPQVAILGLYRIADRPVVRDGEVVVRPMGNVSVTFDHRVIDGKRAAEFGLAVIARLESRS
jgi:pyruvate/2-oxoglutarate dehydrogenase complex dihydrolipoamide acyltransferase (E2) component